MTETPGGSSQPAGSAAAPAEAGRIAGIDVSHDQSRVDWPAVTPGGVVFAFAKATEGLTFVDPQFAANWQGIAAAGLVRGAYHFFTPTDDVAAQAEHFLSRVELGPRDLPPVLDVEVSGGLTPPALTQAVQSWLSTVEARTQRVPIIYTNHAFWNANIIEPLSRYPLWIAEYGVTAPRVPTGWARWTFWQHSEGGSVPGVRGAVDLNYFNGTAGDLDAFVRGSVTTS